MPVPTAITDLSTVAASNYPQGSDSPSTLDDVQRAHGSFIAQIRDGAVAVAIGNTVPAVGKFTQATATPSAPLPASGVGSFAYKASGSFGGGYGLIDGTYNIGLYSTSGSFNVAFGTSLGALTSKFSIDSSGNVQAAGNGSFTGNVTANQFISSSAGAPTFGGPASVGFYSDATNVSIRPPTGGAIYFQSSGGTTTFGNMDSAGLHLTAGCNYSGGSSGLTGTAASLTAGAASTDNQHFGAGQTWQNVIGSRTNGNPYTNPSSTKAMSVYVRGNHSSLGIPTIQATIGGVEVGYLQLGQSAAGVSGDLCLSFIVPPSATYTVTSSTGVAVWSELF